MGRFGERFGNVFDRFALNWLGNLPVVHKSFEKMTQSQDSRICYSVLKQCEGGRKINRKKSADASIVGVAALVLVVVILMAIGYVIITKFYEVVLPNQPFFTIMAVAGFIGICILVIAEALSRR